MIVLREYQAESVQLVMECYQDFQSALLSGDNELIEKTRFEMLVLATGAGKTCIFSEVIKRLGVPAMVLAHRDDLLNQAIDKYTQIKPDAICGKVGGKYNDLGGELTVASVASACKPARLKKLTQFGYAFIVVDEGHHMAANSYKTVLAAFPYAFVLVVTATPDRLDGKPVIEKAPLMKLELPALVKMGYLATPRARAIRTEVNLDKVGTTAGDFNQEQLSDAVDTPARNRLIVESWQEHARGRATIGFCVTIVHAESLCYTFNDYGIACEVVVGGTSEEERIAIYKRLRTGETKVLLSIQVLTEGFDEPCVSCIIMARPTKSRALYVQCVGRGARLYPGKNDFLILDITDNCLKHRLAPHTFQKALKLEQLRDNETMEEQEERIIREQKDAEEREKRVRKITDKRKEDIIVDLLQAFPWIEKDGNYSLTFGLGGCHRLEILSNGDMWDIPLYSVVAYLQSSQMRPQTWLTGVVLSEALQYAETKIIKLEHDPSAIQVLDKFMLWRAKPVDMAGAQAWNARKKGIQIDPFMTKGELADLLDVWYAKDDMRKREIAIERQVRKEVESGQELVTV